jgi:uncharacterized membrane protein YphA (DoxX/SURF4 family)
VGLLLLRVGAAIPLIYFGVESMAESSGQLPVVSLGLIAAAGGLLLLVGLWTPVAGSVIAIDELWNAFLHQGDHWLHLVLAVLAAGVAMLGPGAWSLDARLFGRKRFEVNGRNRRHDHH